MCESKAIEQYEKDRLLSKQAQSVSEEYALLCKYFVDKYHEVFKRACPSTLAEYYKGKVSLQSLVIVSSALAKD